MKHKDHLQILSKGPEQLMCVAITFLLHMCTHARTCLFWKTSQINIVSLVFLSCSSQRSNPMHSSIYTQ